MQSLTYLNGVGWIDSTHPDYHRARYNHNSQKQVEEEIIYDAYPTLNEVPNELSEGDIALLEASSEELEGRGIRITINNTTNES